MKHLFGAILAGLLVMSQGCATSKLWEDADPNERIWIDGSKTTEAALKQRGVDYQVYNSGATKGYLLKKSSVEKMKDYQLRMLGTPVTLIADAAGAVAVVGVYMFLADPAGTVSLIEQACR
jgi:hypothetical protein